LISDRLIIVWKEVFGQEINFGDVKKGKLQTIGIASGYILGLRMIEDGPRVLLLYEDSIWAKDICTGESVCVERPKGDSESVSTFQMDSSKGFARFDTLRMDGSKVLIRFGESSVQGWYFGTPDLIPIQFSETSLCKSHLNIIDIRAWSMDSPVIIEDGVTGEKVFQLCGKYAEPSAIQWDGQYLIAGYDSGEVLILDFNALS